MIPYEELDKALARWKARTQNAAADAAREFEESGAVPAAAASGASGGTRRPDHTGEIDLGDVESVVEAYEES
ncbi:MAG TPA: hypothetical protein VHL80_09850 [Polyangia bacterium]|nr:hypothetical protein [Polyangia bacterium]